MATKTKRRRKPDKEEEILFPEAAHLPPREESRGSDDHWLHQHDEGQLAVDVYETDKELIIKTAIAGVREEDIEVFLHNDMLTIRGKRTEEKEEKGARFVVRECHWGSFSRSLILPTEIDADNISATLRNGIMTIRLPKIERSKKIKVKKV